MSDIVEEARSLDGGAFESPAHYAAHLTGLCEDMATEIERLRAENERLWSLCRNVYGSDKYIYEAMGEQR